SEAAARCRMNRDLCLGLARKAEPQSVQEEARSRAACRNYIRGAELREADSVMSAETAKSAETTTKTAETSRPRDPADGATNSATGRAANTAQSSADHGLVWR